MGNSGEGGALEVSISIPLTVDRSLVQGFRLRDTAAIGIVLDVDKMSIGVVGQSLQLQQTAISSALNVGGEDPVLEAIAQTGSNLGEVASTMASAKLSSSLARAYQFTTSGATVRVPALYRVEVDMPWRYEQQAIELHTRDGTAPVDGAQASITFHCYDLNETTNVVLGGMGLVQLAANLEAALASLHNLGDTTVTYLLPNSTSPSTLFGTLYVIFTSNAGDVPLLEIQPLPTVQDDGNSSHSGYTVSVVETRKGMLVAEEQEIVLESSTPLSSTGQFYVAFNPNKRKPHNANGTSKDYITTYTESAILSVGYDVSEMQEALSNLPGIGLIKVNRTDSSSINGTRIAWRVTFLTAIYDVDPLVVVSPVGLSTPSANFYTTTCAYPKCVAFNASGVKVSVITHVNGTQLIGGSFVLQVL